jgi:hypothetical protein
MEKAVSKGFSWSRHAAFVVMAAASLSLPMLSIARADPPADRPHAATVQPKNHAKTAWQSAAQRQKLYGSARPANTGRCSWPYQNQFPPCMSTWPAGDPHYHGSRPGPTFDDE